MKITIDYKYEPDGTPECCWALTTIDGKKMTAVETNFPKAKQRLLDKISHMLPKEQVVVPFSEEVEIDPLRYCQKD